MLVFSAIMPHPPVSVPGIGNEDELNALKKTQAAFEVLRSGLELAHPDVVVVISPHAPMEPYSFVINSNSTLRGNLMEFGLDQVVEYKNDMGIAESLEYACQTNEIPTYLHDSLLDYGTLVPLFHLLKNIHPHVVHLAFSLLDLKAHYMYGEVLGKICNDSPKRVAVIASGDLSHRLTPNAPAGYSPDAKFFDQRVIEGLGKRDFPEILSLHQHFMGDAAECGLRSFVILMGILHGKDYTFDLLSYEGPFGVGYLTARLL